MRAGGLTFWAAGVATERPGLGGLRRRLCWALLRRARLGRDLVSGVWAVSVVEKDLFECHQQCPEGQLGDLRWGERLPFLRVVWAVRGRGGVVLGLVGGAVRHRDLRCLSVRVPRWCPVEL